MEENRESNFRLRKNNLKMINSTFFPNNILTHLYYAFFTILHVKLCEILEFLREIYINKMTRQKKTKICMIFECVIMEPTKNKKKCMLTTF